MAQVEVKSRHDTGPRRACIGALAVVVLFYRLVPADSDTPWHLANGRLLLHRWAGGHLGIGGRDVLSWTARGLTWHANGWAFDALMAAAYEVARWPGVALLRVAFLTAVVVFGWKMTGRLPAGAWARAGAVWLGAIFLVPFSAMRPQLASFALLPLCLLLTRRILDPEQTRPAGPLAVLAAVVALWACLHGVVIAGVIAVGAACVGAAIKRRSIGRPAVVAIVAAAASCISPLGFSVWTYAFKTSGASLAEHIEEWQRPSIHRAEDVVISALLLTLVAWALWIGRRTREWEVVLPLLALTAMAFQAVRNEPLALIAGLAIAAHALTSIGGAIGRRGWNVPLRPDRVLLAITVGALLGGVIRTGGPSLNPDPMTSSNFPVASAGALPSGCRLLNEYDDGGYLILARPDVPVSQDGRNDLYGEARLNQQESLFDTSDPTRAAASLNALGVNCVLARPTRPLVHALALLPGWHLMAADTHDQAWIRPGLYADAGPGASGTKNQGNGSKIDPNP